MVNSIIDVKTQVKVYKKHKNEIFDTNCKAKPYSTDIYKILTSELKGMTAKGIQTSINRNVKKNLDDQEVNEDINKENRHCFPSEFLDVIMQVEDNVNETNKSHSKDNGVVLTKEFVDGVHGETLGSEIQNESTEDVDDIDTDDTFVTESHTFDSFYKLYHKQKPDDVIAQLPASYETVCKQLEMIKQVIVTLNKSHLELVGKHGRCSEQVQECEKSRLNHVKLSNDEIKKSLEKVENLRLEVRTLNESNQQISGAFDALNNDFKASERHRSELLDREKLAGDEIKKSLTKVQSLQLEIRTLTESNQQISGDFDALKNELKASERHRSELLDREKLSGDEIKKSLEKVENLRLEVRTLNESNQQIRGAFDALNNDFKASERHRSELLDREKLAGDEIKKSLEKVENLRLEVRTLNESNQQISGAFNALNNDFKASERHRSELLDREKLAGDEIKKSLEKVENLRLEVRTLNESNQQISGAFNALNNDFKASERHRSELLDHEKLAGDEIKKSLEKVENLQLEVHTLSESKCRSTDERKSEFNKRSRKRKLTSKYYGPEWSH